MTASSTHAVASTNASRVRAPACRSSALTFSNAALGVKMPTLYTYVSRGLIRSELAAGGGKRAKRHRAEDVRRLKERQEQRRDPNRAAKGALRFGMPVM